METSVTTALPQVRVRPQSRGFVDRSRDGIAPDTEGLIRVDGKLFARGETRFRVQGVTYGPFAPNAQGEAFPDRARAQQDFEQMRTAGINAIRTYHLPPAWLLELAGEQDVSVLVDVPWARHLCFLESKQLQAETRQAVRTALERGREFPNVFAYSIGNEIPANIVRWHGARRVERFLQELTDEARQIHPQALITYANYPSTEYLDLSFLDFVTFNVYLHDRDTFRRYLLRLQNIVGDMPLLLGELGMDTLRQGELEQAEFLAGHLREVTLMGLAGAFVFSWTDDWHTGGHCIEDWAFGITDRERAPKASYHAVREVFEKTPAALMQRVATVPRSGATLPVAPPRSGERGCEGTPPRVSVIVCSYNGGRTLEQCLRSLLALDYPDYEVIVVDDGSTDNTPEILERFPTVRAVRQENRGLSAARNVGLHAASGAIVAYTDSDCFVDGDWLSLLVHQMEETGAAAVGGPNLTPDDGWLAGCVAACPGQPMHVLESDQVAEHIPGCNMAYRREVLLEINGFDYQYRTAGDDVDICWRLQQAGHWITFAPGAFVWHHRRQTPRAYLRQQAGYGEAEALLRFTHPDRFNGRGDGKWNGVLYGMSLQGLCLDKPIIYRGTFGTGLFQCIYQPRPAHWAMLPSTLEWHLVIAICCLAIPVWPCAVGPALTMWLLSLLVAGLQTIQANLAPEHDGFRSRMVVMFLCYAQPLVRSWSRQRTRFFSYRRPAINPELPASKPSRLPLIGRCTAAYWSENGIERTHLLGLIIAHLNEQRWSKAVDTGWESWDVEVLFQPWTAARISTAQEEHGSGKRLIRVQYQVRPSGYTQILWGLGATVAALGVAFSAWPYLAAAGLLAMTGAAVYWRGTFRAAYAVKLVDSAAKSLELIPCDPVRHSATDEVPSEVVPNQAAIETIS